MDWFANSNGGIGLLWVALPLLALTPLLLDYARQTRLGNQVALAGGVGLLAVVLLSFEPPTAETPSTSSALRVRDALAGPAEAPRQIIPGFRPAPVTQPEPATEITPSPVRPSPVSTPAPVAVSPAPVEPKPVEPVAQPQPLPPPAKIEVATNNEAPAIFPSPVPSAPPPAVVPVPAPPPVVTSAPPPVVNSPTPVETSIAPPVAQPAPAPEPAPEPARASARERLDRGGGAPLFAWERLADCALVPNQSGSCYSISFIDPATSKPFAFARERYVFTARDQVVRGAFKSFLEDLVASLPAGAKASLYLRAFAQPGKGARAYKVSSQLTDLKKVAYLKLAPDKIHNSTPAVDKVIGATIGDSEMPLLRALVAQRLFNAEAASLSMTILESASRKPADPLAESFEIVMYVDWP